MREFSIEVKLKLGVTAKNEDEAYEKVQEMEIVSRDIREQELEIIGVEELPF